MKKALKIGIMGMIGFMLFIYGGLNGYCMAWSRLYDRGNHIGAYGLSYIARHISRIQWRRQSGGQEARRLIFLSRYGRTMH